MVLQNRPKQRTRHRRAAVRGRKESRGHDDPGPGYLSPRAGEQRHAGSPAESQAALRDIGRNRDHQGRKRRICQKRQVAGPAQRLHPQKRAQENPHQPGTGESGVPGRADRPGLRPAGYRLGTRPVHAHCPGQVIKLKC